MKTLLVGARRRPRAPRFGRGRPCETDSGDMELQLALKVQTALRADPLRRQGSRAVRLHARQARWEEHLLRRVRRVARLLLKGKVKAMRGVKQALIGTVRGRSGRLQVTYNGWPLYYYAHEGHAR